MRLLRVILIMVVGVAIVTPAAVARGRTDITRSRSAAGKGRKNVSHSRDPSKLVSTHASRKARKR